MNKKIIFLGLMFSLIATQASAIGTYDEQWRRPTWNGPTDHKITIDSEMPIMNSISHLWAQFGWPDGRSARYTCSSVNDEHCQDAQAYSYSAIFPICTEISQRDCIETVSAGSATSSLQNATFLRYTLDRHPNNFLPDQKLGLPANANPSLWSIPSAQTVNGNQYVLSVGLEGVKNLLNPNDSYEYLFAYLTPVESHANALSKIGACVQDQNAPNSVPGVVANTMCAGAAEYYTSPEVPKCNFADGESGACFSPIPFPKNVRYSISLRLKNEPTGWLHGRISSPDVEITNIDNGTRLVMTAEPVTVPTFHLEASWSNLSPVTQSWWLKDFPICNQKLDCQQAGGLHASDPRLDTQNSFVGVNVLPSGDGAIGVITKLSQEVSDKAIVAPSVWSFRTLASEEMNGTARCLNSGKGLKGIVSTNSTAYSSGPPSFDGSLLNYKVASLHFLPDGSIFKGSYDLLMRSDIARCLYGFSNAGISASISVTNSEGENAIATTSSSESKGWLHLSAKNFTFSSPTIKVKFSQNKPISKLISCRKGKTIKRIQGANQKCPDGFKRVN